MNSLLLHLQGKVFIPSIQKLRDCDIREGAELVDSVEAATCFKNDEYHELVKWLEAERLTEAEKEYLRLNCNYPGANQRMFFSHYYDFIRRSRFAWCWFQSDCESAAMWKLYAAGGVAIETSLSRLQSSLQAQGRDWLISRMNYMDFRRHYPGMFAQSKDGHEWVRRPFLLKGKEYVHEQEVRLVTVAPDSNDGLLLEEIKPASWIQRIVLPSGLPASQLRAIEWMVQTLCPDLSGTISESALRRHSETSNGDNSLDGFLATLSQNSLSKAPAFLKLP